MQMTATLLPQDGFPDSVDPAKTTAVVIDVLRATSVIATAIANGATKIVTTETISEAHQIALVAEKPLLCGERHCQRIEGFELGNSPAEYDRSTVSGRTLVMTTTNGTRALAAANAFARVLTASFLHLQSVIESLAGQAKVHLICAGTDGQVTEEDALLAGALIERCRKRYGATLHNSGARAALSMWQAATISPAAGEIPEIIQALLDSLGGRNLQAAGHVQDIYLCGQQDTLSVNVQRVASSPTTLAGFAGPL